MFSKLLELAKPFWSRIRAKTKKDHHKPDVDALDFSRIDSATRHRASQDVSDFGVAVSGQDTDEIRTAGNAIDRLDLGPTNQLTVPVAPTLETGANALTNRAHSTGRIGIAITALCDNIGRLPVTTAWHNDLSGRSGQKVVYRQCDLAITDKAHKLFAVSSRLSTCPDDGARFPCCGSF